MTREECENKIHELNNEVAALAKARGFTTMFLLTDTEYPNDDGSTEELVGRMIIGEPGRVLLRLAACYGQFRTDFLSQLNNCAYRGVK